MFSQNLSKTSGICEACADSAVQHSTIQIFGESGVLSLEPARLGQQHLQQD